jgi:hypothetical protein
VITIIATHIVLETMVPELEQNLTSSKNGDCLALGVVDDNDNQTSAVTSVMVLAELVT